MMNVGIYYDEICFDRRSAGLKSKCLSTPLGADLNFLLDIYYFFNKNNNDLSTKSINPNDSNHLLEGILIDG